jgi:adenylosuccinate lyase
MAAAERVKLHGKSNNLIELIKQDEAFGLSADEIDNLMDPKAFTGCASVQTQDFINEHVKPVLAKYADRLGVKGEVNV